MSNSESSSSSSGSGSSSSGSKNAKSEENQDELIIKQQREIEQEIAHSNPLVSESQPIASLNQEYLDDPVYISKIKDLSTKYRAIRRSRPDGNCFFRAFAYAYLEYLVRNKDEFQKFYEYASKSRERLTEAGFPPFTIEDFYETFMEVIGKVKPEGDNTAAALAEPLLKSFIFSLFLIGSSFQSKRSTPSSSSTPRKRTVVKISTAQDHEHSSHDHEHRTRASVKRLSRHTEQKCISVSCSRSKSVSFSHASGTAVSCETDPFAIRFDLWPPCGRICRFCILQVEDCAEKQLK